ncbi:MAG: hypothetical protein ABJO14_01450 [Haloferula sp.]|uniref:hypothetical protein n=1 Tax=Haloferula sp. TaxID=2497595 RepID=UPI00329B5BBC
MTLALSFGHTSQADTVDSEWSAIEVVNETEAFRQRQFRLSGWKFFNEGNISIGDDFYACLGYFVLGTNHELRIATGDYAGSSTLSASFSVAYNPNDKDGIVVHRYEKISSQMPLDLAYIKNGSFGVYVYMKGRYAQNWTQWRVLHTAVAANAYSSANPAHDNWTPDHNSWSNTLGPATSEADFSPFPKPSISSVASGNNVDRTVTLAGSSINLEADSISIGGQMNLTGATPEIWVNGNSILSVDSTGAVNFTNNSPLVLANTSPSTSSTTGALTVAGGIGVSEDSYINEIRIGKGSGNPQASVAFGEGALLSNTTGDYNTAIGLASLSSNTSGGNNVAVGSFSLNKNTIGNWNTAIGSHSLHNNSTGKYNSSMGFSSLNKNTEGSDNVGLGWASLHFNTIGNNNCASGSYSLYYNTTGSANTAYGYGALVFNDSGSNNVAIGDQAGAYSTTYEYFSPENSIYIGARSKGLDDNDDNSIVIGANAVGEGANTTVIGNSFTTNTHLYGATEVGNNAAPSPTAVLTVGNGPDSSDPQNALEVHQNGDVIITKAQGDISMGIFE